VSQKPLRQASAGSLQSGDCLVEIRPPAFAGGPEDQFELVVTSIVSKMFGERIRLAAIQALQSAGVTGASVYINDRGALDFVIEARVAAAARRASAPVEEVHRP